MEAEGVLVPVEADSSQSYSEVLVAQHGRVLGAIRIVDILRPEAAAAIREIRGTGCRIFLSTVVGGLATYVTTAVQLALANASAHGGYTASFVKFLGVFLITQIPISIAEGRSRCLYPARPWSRSYSPCKPRSASLS
jgi:cobalamin biosynthesis protein CbiM